MPPKTIYGYVYHFNNESTNGADVIVEAPGLPNELTTVTGNAYQVDISGDGGQTYWPDGTSFTVTITLDNYSGISHGIVQGTVTQCNVNLYPIGYMIATANVNNPTPYVNENIFFNGTVENGTPPFSWEWDFDDNSPNSYVQNPVHQYSASGEYNVTLYITDSIGNVSSDSISITVLNNNLVAQVSVYPRSTYINQTVLFNATIINGNPPFTSIWDFDDGSPYSYDQNTTHSYSQQGIYNVLFTITDNGGETYSKSIKIIVSPICPVEWEWVKSATGNIYQSAMDLSVDRYGNSYIIGDFAGEVEFGPHNLTDSGSVDIFIAKINRSGEWQWAIRAGGHSDFDFGNAITTDDQGNCYITGQFYSTAFFGPYELISRGHHDIFIAKIDTNGNWQWAKRAGGNSSDYSHDLLIDKSGNLIVNGDFNGVSDFGHFSLQSKSGPDAFIANIDPQGNWNWVVQGGGNDSVVWSRCIYEDISGNNYITGFFDGNAIFGNNIISSVGGNDVFIAKLNISNQWEWARRAGGSDRDDRGFGITGDSNGNIYVTGECSGEPDFGPFTITCRTRYDIFITKLNSNGEWLWVNRAGGDGWYNCGFDIVTDINGNIFVTGKYTGNNADFGTILLPTQGEEDIFITKLDSDGYFQWVKRAGGGGYDNGGGLGFDNQGNLHITGVYTTKGYFDNITLDGTSFNFFVGKLFDKYGNKPPCADANGPYFINEGENLLVDGSLSYDFDGNITFFSWDFDNNDIFDDINGSNPLIEWSTLKNYNICDDGKYSISLKVVDDGGYEDIDESYIIINNSPPVVILNEDATIFIGQSFTDIGSFIDPGCDTWNATVDYGDGTGEQILSLNVFNFSLEHQYTEIGEFIVNVTVIDDNGGVGTDTIIVIVNCIPEVWVNDNAHPDWYDYAHVGFLQTGLDRVCPGGTVNVYPGYYHDFDQSIDIYKSALTVQKTTIPFFADGEAIIQHPVLVTADDISFTGFTLEPSEGIPAFRVTNDADASTIHIFRNKFMKDCESDAHGIENQDTNMLDARNNYWGTPDGPSGLVIDPVTARKADGFGVEIIDNGPIMFDPWAGIDAKATVDTTAVEQGTPIGFDASESFAYHLDSTPNDFTVLWDFDDGTYSTNLNPSHVYDTPGTYEVSLRVEAIDTILHPGLMYDWYNITITVFQPGTPLSCTADGSNLGGYEGTRNTKISFFGTAIGGTPPYTFNWDMDDGTSNTEQNPIHTYTESGKYTVTLTVTDSSGNIISDNAEVIVTEPALLESSITSSTADIKIDETIVLMGSASGGLTPYTYIWNIGDEEFLGKTLSYTFKQKGIYKATLTVIDFEGTTTTSTVEITVSDTEELSPEILEANGGFGFSTVIKTNDDHVTSSITVDGTVWIGGTETVNIPKHTTQTVKLPFTIGFGKVEITIQANDVSKQYTAFLFGPFFLNLQMV